MSRSHGVYSRHRNPHTELCFWSLFASSKVFLPSYLLDHTVLYLWRWIGLPPTLDRGLWLRPGVFLLVSAWEQILYLWRQKEKDDEERREGDDSALIKWRGNTLTSAKPEETGTCKSSAGFMRWYTNPAFYEKCWLMWLVILTLRPFLFYPCSTVIRLHDCQVLCDWECALKQMEPFQDKAAVSLIFTRRLELTPTLIRAPVTTHLIVLSVWHQTTHSSLSFTLKLVFSDLQVCDLACLFKSIEWLQCTGNQNISSCRTFFHFDKQE